MSTRARVCVYLCERACVCVRVLESCIAASRATLEVSEAMSATPASLSLQEAAFIQAGSAIEALTAEAAIRAAVFTISAQV